MTPVDAPEPPIAAYGLIGDGRTAALCSDEGSIDWLCLPRFDSDPVFGRLVGGDSGGCFSIRVAGARETERRYREDSAVLETMWRVGPAEVTLTEGMVLDVSRRLAPQSLLVRRVEARGGRASIRIRFDPRSGLPGAPLPCSRRAGALVFVRGGLALGLRATAELDGVPGGEAEIELEPGRPVTLALSVADRQPLVLADPDESLRELRATDEWWRRWAGRISYDGPMVSSVVRSLITLRLLTYSPSGAPVAAPTTSLPEDPGGIRNWDYRYSWPRDASIGASAFLAVGMADEARSFLNWLLVASRLTRPRLHVAYTLDGKPGLEEREASEAPGYRGSRPVRLGNEAATQHQLDVYGWVLDAACAYERSGHRVNAATWRAASGFADFVARRWRDPDAGIWEVRSDALHHVHSKVMGWVALDRAVRLARSHRTRGSRVRGWEGERDELAADVRDRGFDRERGSYVGNYGSSELDAALLMLPALGFDAPDAPAASGTVDAIRRSLSAGGPLLYRYPPGTDGLEGGEGAFLPCSFWLVQALAHLGRMEEAHDLFEELCARSTDLGLYAEEMDPSSGEHLGNFPQALTHAALIQAALALQPATAG